ncbi:ComEC/Rec2 family competence protein [Salsipaludibacter albus]|uniref:ComEC/Rec2 family competence protein n=1 Tax=Salsipaludibacter albus TaxID=2849650 RepID=UPI001EE3B4B1|nr:MBL fold metallo-hydrolase [Salsipaludibacter albus]MBY5160869.1 MBL fold metallo-hydrolase [Salsipaludibacter albus]
MSAISPLPSDGLDDAPSFVEAVTDEDLLYFCANVGDADAQLLLLPPRPPHATRRAIVVDAGRSGKIEGLLALAVDAGWLPTTADGSLAPDAIALVVATHPHADHIRGLSGLLASHGHAVSEYWDSGYFHPSRGFHDLMGQISGLPHLLYAQPTSGFRRWLHQTRITVLAPAIHLRNRYDTYGVEVNSASITLRLDYPAPRVLQRDEDRVLVDHENAVSMILGGDAQTDSWAHVATDFPALHAHDNAAAEAIGAATGIDHLRADVLKVPHHASKHGINLELMERMSPKVTLVSSTDRSPQYNFPHAVTQDILREALEPTMGLGTPRSADHDLGLFYTADRDAAGRALGTIAMRLRPGTRDLWRLGDEPGDLSFDPATARRWRGR